MKYIIIIGIILTIILYKICNVQHNKTELTNVENFDGKYGHHCFTCSGKTINQCTECANCGFCLDSYGNAKCIPGDIHGPYDKRIHCRMWYHSDPYSRMLWYNKWRRSKPYKE